MNPFAHSSRFERLMILGSMTIPRCLRFPAFILHGSDLLINQIKCWRSRHIAKRNQRIPQPNPRGVVALDHRTAVRTHYWFSKSKQDHQRVWSSGFRPLWGNRIAEDEDRIWLS